MADGKSGRIYFRLLQQRPRHDRASFEDVVIEKQRQALIPGFSDVRRDALDAGALGCSISARARTILLAQAAHHR